VTPYIDAIIGFGCKKKLNPQDTKNVSGIGLYISNDTYNEPSSTRKAFYITATYGEELSDGIRMRSEHNFLEPLDLEFRDEFFYDTNTEKIYREDKEITGDELLQEVYTKHIKTTKPIRGLFLRIKLRFWRIWLPWLLKLVSNFFHYFLLLISGDKYSYEFLFQEEKLNGTIISSKMEGRVGRSRQLPEGKEKEKEAKKMEFFGIIVPQWPIVFYSALHLSAWSIAKYYALLTDDIKNFFDNNFLVVLYVIVSFWLIETVLPFLSKKLIKLFSTLSFLASAKKVRV
jgi:hypothetical protein